MNVKKYVCECFIGDEVRRIVTKAYSKRGAKSAAKNYLRERGYKVLLKDINPMYIDNSQTSVNG
jgi:hypothetical protein